MRIAINLDQVTRVRVYRKNKYWRLEYKRKTLYNNKLCRLLGIEPREVDRYYHYGEEVSKERFFELVKDRHCYFEEGTVYEHPHIEFDLSSSRHHSETKRFNSVEELESALSECVAMMPNLYTLIE